MLQSIHDKLKGWLAAVVLSAIGLVFVFWGINWTLSAPNYAAKVNGIEISSIEVREAYQRQLAQFERQSNGTIDDATRTQIKRHVLDEYVNTEALVTRADDLGYRVSDDELLKAMAQVQAFQVDGKFDKVRALAVLRAQGRSIAEIENLIRRDVKVRQLDTALSSSSFVTANELEQLRTLTQQQRELSWFTVSAAKYTAEATADDAALKTYYEAHKAEYMTPETVNLRYLEISTAQLESKVSVDDAQLKAYYEEQKAKTPERFTQAERRRVRHILLQVTDPKEDAAVKVKADRNQLFRVLVNLLRNASEAGARNVRLYVRSIAPVVIDVEDDGPGLPEEVRADLFRAFAASIQGGGAGLGLAIARDLMVAHGGEIELLETGPAGTTFRLTLPAAEQAAQPGGARIAPATPADV